MPSDDTKYQRRNPRGGTRSEVSQLRCVNCGQQVGPGEGYECWQDERGQPQARHTIRLYFDECTASVRKALNRMGFCIAPSLPQGTPDTEWLAHAGREGYVVITQDANITRNDAEMQAIIDNNVRCFVLPGETKSTWDSVRRLATMWGKIREESVFSGPFIWLLDEREYRQWKQIHPEPREDYKPLGLSRTPVGHLLNLFADVVHQHDEGWFSAAYVERLHDHIRVELEARITRDRSSVPAPSPAPPLLHERLGPSEAGGGHEFDLETPLNTDSDRIVELFIRPDDTPDEYVWLVPARRLRYYVKDPSDADKVDDATIGLSFSPTGFCRCGFGVRPRLVGQ